MADDDWLLWLAPFALVGGYFLYGALAKPAAAAAAGYALPAGPPVVTPLQTSPAPFSLASFPPLGNPLQGGSDSRQLGRGGVIFGGYAGYDTP